LKKKLYNYICNGATFRSDAKAGAGGVARCRG